jgi:hypothetical protein
MRGKAKKTDVQHIFDLAQPYVGSFEVRLVLWSYLS